MSESFAELFEESLVKTQMRPGSIIPGIVVQIDDDFVIVHAGLKSEGVIPLSQFMNEKGEIEVVVGDSVDVAMDMIDDGFGETRLSREKAKRAEAWTVLEVLLVLLLIKSKVALRLILVTSAHSYQVH